MSIYIWDKEIKNLFVWESISISDMQWPCDIGFHVPTKDEWTTVYNILDGLDASYMRTLNYVKTYLKLPPNWYLTPDTARSYELWTSCWYWSCEKNWNYSWYCVYCDNWHAFNVTNMYSWYGLPIRPFKDGVVNPISSWSTLKSWWTWLYHSGSNNYWIAHNSSDWIISLSSDGTTWITMADKNVWATTVYNNWDTQTEDNCGKAYQRWNNYWFPITGTSWAISWPVDASAYWPWNYYSSGFVITNYSASYNWDSSYNKNLRWWVTQWTTEEWAVKAVYLWENKVRPAKKELHTCTIVWDEVSSPSSFFVRYEDDAAGLTPWDTAFDEFFWYYGCRLNTSWQETATITQEQSWWAWKLDITQLGTLTSGDNVMIAFPVRWIKMTKSWSTVTLSITDELNKSWYQYYAHSTWTLTYPWTPKGHFYLWVYKTCNNGSNVLKSWSWVSPEVNQTQNRFCTRASANGRWYNIIWYYQRMYINALYMMKYWNPDSQTVVWKWYVGWGSRQTTWSTNSQTNATYWTTSTTQQAKLFWLEDWWGNVYEWIWWVYTNWSKNLCTQLSWYSWAVSGWDSTWSTIQTTSWSDLSSIVWNNKVLFWPSATVSNSSYNTYYCDYEFVGASYLAFAGGSGDDGSYAGAFNMSVAYNASGKRDYIGSRLMFLY